MVSYDPSFTVSKNTEIVLDENKTGRFDYKVGRPVVNDGAILDVAWNGEAGYTGFTFFGSVDRLYARPSAGLTGGAPRARWCGHVASNWLLSQPEGLLTPRARQAGGAAAAHGARRPARDHAGHEGRRQLPGRRRRQRSGTAHQVGQGRGRPRVRHAATT